MNITEKISYIKGLCEGLSLDEKKPEVKVINAIIDLLDDIAYDLTDMEELYDELSDQVDEIDQDLAEVESELYDEDCDCCDDDDDDYDEDEVESFTLDLSTFEDIVYYMQKMQKIIDFHTRKI